MALRRTGVPLPVVLSQVRAAGGGDAEVEALRALAEAAGPPAAPQQSGAVPPDAQPGPAPPATLRDKFQCPLDVHVADGRVYVADSGHSAVLVFDEVTGELVGTVGSGLKRPVGVAVAAGTCWVSEAGRHRVLGLNLASGKVQAELGGDEGDAPGQFRGPSGVAVAGGEVFIADRDNHRIQVFSVDGPLLRVLGGKGDEPGQLKRFDGIGWDNLGLLVADFGNGRVQRFASDGGSATVLATGLDRPQAVTCDDERKLIFVSEKGGRVIRSYRVEGETMEPGEVLGAGVCKFPAGLAAATAGGGGLYVADSGLGRVLKLAMTIRDEQDRDETTPHEEQPAMNEPPSQSRGRRPVGC